MAETVAQGHDGGEHHDPHVAHHFDTAAQQFDSHKLGMWLFLSTEILLFGGLFCAYAVYRSNHPEIFLAGHKHLDATLGGINTAILIASSFTMAWAVRAAQLSQQRLLVTLLSLTLLGGFGFLGIKAVEYEHKWHKGLLWAGMFAPQKDGEHGGRAGDPNAHDPNHGEEISAADADVAVAGGAARGSAPPAEPNIAGLERSTVMTAAAGPEGLYVGETRAAQHHEAEAKNLQIFFSIYFFMTGLHGLHVIIGMLVISWLIYRASNGHFSKDYFNPVDLGGLYWHLVDLVWIFLFPLLYLIH